MSVELEERISASLRTWAEAVEAEAPPIDAVVGRPRRLAARLVRPALVAAALALVVAIGVAVARSGEEAPTYGDRPSVGGPAEGTAPAAPVGDSELARILGPSATIAFPPGSDWAVRRFSFSAPEYATARTAPDSSGNDFRPTTYVEYGFEGPSGESLQVSFYDLGQRSPTVTTPEPPLVEVRGATGYFLDYGAGRFRVQWDEGGRTLEADGQPYADLGSFVDVLDQLQVVDDATWAEAMPNGLAQAVLDHPTGSVSWYAEDGAIRAASG